MDARGEHQIFTALREMAPGRITLVVMHRLDHVRMADRIPVLDRGRVREEGAFDQPPYEDGLFAELYALSQDR
ncbi:ABC transporter ATP-binding protein/permease [Streptomyces sp. NRRL B-24720]|uniref:ABC transporter ATP-binding protein/permease n=1 Tax=Streptomyces sp. NRRL B-24720 TaxID=1476876 RepID=UPI0004C541CB|nr:ABC transporter ATP-binding protein/permease [Streptomyces sp. NRRL B-24720]